MTTPPFWQVTALSDMTDDEWESLCDGCGKCCVIKLEDIDTSVIHYTDVGCRLLDGDTCQCKDYSNRKAIVPDCVILTPKNLEEISWMPMSCAYRRLSEGRGLPEWHPLITGDKDSTHKAGMSVRGKIFTESDIADDDYPDHITDWDNSNA
ncbi:MAG: YcgN family cysteine cluster protein [Candidatus Puniceispirillales bacterium WSBS_2018_MAG_OTU23]